MVIVTSINVPLWLEVWKEVCRTGEGKGTTVELKMLFHQSFNEDADADDDDDDYLWQGMNREWKGGRGASIRTEVKRSRNPANKINIMLSFYMTSIITSSTTLKNYVWYPVRILIITDYDWLFKMVRLIPRKEASWKGEWKGKPRRWMRSNTSARSGKNLPSLLIIADYGCSL